MKDPRASRALFCVALLLLAALALAACGGSDTTGDAASSSPSVMDSPSVTPSETGAPLPAPTVAGTIAFTMLAGYKDNDICLVNTDGTGLKTLAGGEGIAGSPCWSPDGMKIAYAEGAPGPKGLSQIWVMNADGSGKTRLTKGSL